MAITIRRKTSRVGSLMACAAVLAVTTAACGGDTAGTPEGHEGAAMTVTGCLQKADGLVDAYVLTMVNAPTASVGTSGTSSPGTVAREQRREAWHAYRVTAKGQDLDGYVGKQIKVTGTLAETSALKRTEDDSKPVGAREESAPPDIEAGDIGRIDATSVEPVADVCGPDQGRATAP